MWMQITVKVQFFWKGSKQFVKRKKKKTTIKKEVKFVWKFNFQFFLVKDPFGKDDLWQMQYLENLGILVVKNNLPMLFVDSMWLKHLVVHLCSRVDFSFKK
jgi:hypothetical protein